MGCSPQSGHGSWLDTGFVDQHELIVADHGAAFVQKLGDVLLVGGGDLEGHVRGRFLQRAFQRGDFELEAHDVERTVLDERLQLHEEALLAKLTREVEGHLADGGSGHVLGLSAGILCSRSTF